MIEKKVNSNYILIFATGLVLAFATVLMLFYFRQRLFTRTEPIILSS